MPKYIQYYKLQKYVEGQPVQEFKKGEVVKEDWWPTMGSCEQNDQPTWEIVNNEFICEKDNASNLWNQYQKLQKYVGGVPYVPEEFMKGEIVQSGVEFENQEDCEHGYQWILIENDYLCENNEDETYTKYQKMEKLDSNGDPFVPPVYKKGNPIETKSIYKNATNITYDGFLSHTTTTVSKTNDCGETYTIISQTDSVDKINNIAHNTLCVPFKSKGSKIICEYSASWNNIIQKDENIRLASSNLTYNKSDSLHLVLRMGLRLRGNYGYNAILCNETVNTRQDIDTTLYFNDPDDINTNCLVPYVLHLDNNDDLYYKVTKTDNIITVHTLLKTYTYNYTLDGDIVASVFIPTSSALYPECYILTTTSLYKLSMYNSVVEYIKPNTLPNTQLTFNLALRVFQCTHYNKGLSIYKNEEDYVFLPADKDVPDCSSYNSEKVFESYASNGFCGKGNFGKIINLQADTYIDPYSVSAYHNEGVYKTVIFNNGYVFAIKYKKSNTYVPYPQIDCEYGNDNMSNTKKWVDTYYAEEENNGTTPS